MSELCDVNGGRSIYIIFVIKMPLQLLGTVIGTSMNKTAKVLVTRMVLHPKLKKYWNHRKVYYVHDEGNICTNGDLVRFTQSRPISKTKHFMLEEIVEHAQKVVDPVTGEVFIQDTREGPIVKAVKENIPNL